MFADRKSQSPDSAPSGVRQDMFVTFITCERYSRGSLQKYPSIKESPGQKAQWAYVTVVVTLTLFSHSNSVHILRNWCGRLARRRELIGVRTYLSLGAIRRFDVVHDINVDVVQNDTLLGHPWPLP